MNRDKVYGSFLAISVFLLLVVLLFWIYQNYEIQIQKLQKTQDKLKAADDIVNQLVTPKEKGPVVQPPAPEVKKEKPLAPSEPNTSDNTTQEYPKGFEKNTPQYINQLNQKIVEQNKRTEELNKEVDAINKKYH